MSRPDASGQALRANQDHYAQPGAFDYVSDRYHTKRTQVAKAVLLSRLPASSRTRILLDVGPGTDSPILAARGSTGIAIALDAAFEAVVERTRFDSRLCADVTTGLPLHDDVVDVIYCGELIEHLFDPISFLQDCYRVLRPGGLLLVTTPNIASLQDRARLLIGRAPRHIDPLHPYIRLHIRPFTPHLLYRALRRVGFVPLQLRSNYLDLHIRGKRYNVPFVARILPTFGGTVISLSKKPA